MKFTPKFSSDHELTLLDNLAINVNPGHLLTQS